MQTVNKQNCSFQVKFKVKQVSSPSIHNSSTL